MYTVPQVLLLGVVAVAMGGLLGAGEGEGSCAAEPYRSEYLKPAGTAGTPGENFGLLGKILG